VHHGVQELEYFVVGHVLERRKHPDADRLSVCMVDVGRSTPSQIVCGAPNVAAGQTVAVAKPGAVMPDGRTLAKATLRGVESNGMILAEDELAIGTEHAGILVLEEESAARERGATILGEVAGYGSTSDAHHLTAPEPSGTPAARAIELALADAGLEVTEVRAELVRDLSTVGNDRGA